jgi:putative ATP-dependent endonuclease of OLD family
LLGEGETEAILFAGVAALMDIDLDQAGVRCVEYRQGDISYFLDAANSLGIAWHVFTDADAQGLGDAQKAKDRVPSGTHIHRRVTTMMGATSVEPYLATNGFLDFYETLIDSGRLREITVPKTDATYPLEVVKRINGKPAAAHAIVGEMRRRGAASVPTALRRAILKAAALGRRC